MLIHSNSILMDTLLDDLAPLQDRIVKHGVFRAIKSGEMSLSKFQRGLLDFYPIIANFSEFIRLTCSKVPLNVSKVDDDLRNWLNKNRQVERLHTRWWKQWAIDFGVKESEFDCGRDLPAGIDTLHRYLWRICTDGSLVECLGAINLAIEGPTGLWAQYLGDSLTLYNTQGATVTDRTLRWLKAHAAYDDLHPKEALRFIESIAIHPEEQTKALHAAKQSLEYYVLALDSFNASSQS